MGLVKKLKGAYQHDARPDGAGGPAHTSLPGGTPVERRSSTESGGRAAGFSRLAVPSEVDTTHGRILYLEDINVSFDGFKALNNSP
jgi:hypothetical protein